MTASYARRCASLQQVQQHAVAYGELEARHAHVAGELDAQRAANARLAQALHDAMRAADGAAGAVQLATQRAAAAAQRRKQAGAEQQRTAHALAAAVGELRRGMQ
jgi:hypothetical protein